MRIRSLTRYRRLSQIAFLLAIFLVPILNILRIDTDTHELILFGISWDLGIGPLSFVDTGASAALHIAFQVLFKGLLPWLLFLAFFPVLGFFTGRLFCGWACPEGALFEFSDFFTLRLLGRRSIFRSRKNDLPRATGNRLLYGGIALFSALTIPLAGGAALTGYFVSPKEIWRQIITWQFTPGVQAGIIGVASYILISSLFIRHALCRFVCAAGLMQMLLGWISPFSLRLKLDTARLSSCTDCRRCDSACFMSVIPRKQKRDISCVNCGACRDACDRELGPGKGLFRLGFGTASTPPKTWHDDNLAKQASCA